MKGNQLRMLKGTKKYIHSQSVFQYKSYTGIYIILDLENFFVYERDVTLN